MRGLYSLLFFFLFSFSGFSQAEQLAKNYFDRGRI